MRLETILKVYSMLNQLRSAGDIFVHIIHFSAFFVKKSTLTSILLLSLSKFILNCLKICTFESSITFTSGQLIWPINKMLRYQKCFFFFFFLFRLSLKYTLLPVPYFEIRNFGLRRKSFSQLKVFLRYKNTRA